MRRSATALAAAGGLLLAFAGAAQAFPFVYVANGANSSVSQYDGAVGSLTSLFPTSAEARNVPQDIAISPDGSSVYAPTNDGRVLQYSVGLDGALVAKTPASVAAGVSATAIAISPDGSSVYVATRDAPGEEPSTVPGAIRQYDVRGDGTLAPKGVAQVPAGDSTLPSAIAIARDGAHAYVVSSDTDEVLQFAIGAGGVLSPLSPATIDTSHGPYGIAASPDGAGVYVTNRFMNSVSSFRIGAGGALSHGAPATVATGDGPTGVALSRDGASLYVTNRGPAETVGSVSQYSVGANGALSAKSPATIGAGVEPNAIAVSRDGASVYVANLRGSAISQYDVGAGGALSAKAAATVASEPGSTAIAISPSIAGPSVSILAPLDGAVFQQRAQVVASYSCADAPGGSGIAACIGSVPVGALIETGAPGFHAFTVTATGRAANRTVRSVGYTVTAAPVGSPGSTPTSLACRSTRRFVLTVAARRTKLRKIIARLDGKRLRIRVTAKRRVVTVDLRGQRRRTAKVVVTARNTKGRAYKVTRAFKTC